MTSFISAEGGPIWIKFRRLVQNDMSTVVMCRNRNQIPIWRTFRQIKWHVIPEPSITLQGAATWWIHCHDSRAKCHIAGCKNSIRHIENRCSPYFIFFVLMQFRLWWAAVSSPIHLFIRACNYFGYHLERILSEQITSGWVQRIHIRAVDTAFFLFHKAWLEHFHYHILVTCHAMKSA